MKRGNLVLTAFGVALLGLIAASADARISGKNYLRFGHAVALPGVTLPAGQYTFEAVESNPDVVRVQSRPSGTAHFLAFTKQVTRPANVPRDRAVIFGEATAGNPQPIAVWYELGSSRGHQFIYDNAR